MAKSTEDLIFEIEYAVALCQRHRRLYGRIRGFLLFVTLLGTGGAFSGVMGKAPTLSLIGGVLIAACGVLNHVIDPSGKRAAYDQDHKRYARLLGTARTMDAAALQTKLDELRADDTEEVDALRPVAYNAVVEATGRDASAKYELSTWQKFVSAFA